MSGVVILLLVSPNLVAGHNWVNNPPSRTKGLSKQAPCPARKGNSVSFAVGRGQDFALEWSTGHPGSFTWFAVVSRGNEDKLALHTGSLLQEYLDDAPEEATSGVIGGFTNGEWYDKRFSRWTANGRGVNRADDAELYTKELAPSDATYYQRPDDWRCSRRPPGNLQGGCKHSSVKFEQMEYKKSHVARDLRAAYFSTKFPWLIAVAKYRIVKKRPQDYDLGVLKFPEEADPGEYVIQYLWGGYYDCYDVVLTGTSAKPVIQLVSTWIRVDHCQYRDGYLLTDSTERKSTHRCTIVPDDGDISQCMQYCAGQGQKRRKCSALNIVPFTNPDLVLFRGDRNIPFTNRNCVESELAKEASPDSLVCYGFAQPESDPEVGPSYTISDDPRDPVFYSTCYRKEVIPRIVGYTVEAVSNSTKAEWRFGDQCISCDDAKKNMRVAENAVPFWKIASECKLCHN